MLLPDIFKTLMFPAKMGRKTPKTTTRRNKKNYWRALHFLKDFNLTTNSNLKVLTIVLNSVSTDARRTRPIASLPVFSKSNFLGPSSASSANIGILI